jgi:hypothetical protein
MICRNCARLAYKVRQSMEFIDKNKAPIKKVNLLEESQEKGS